MLMLMEFRQRAATRTCLLLLGSFVLIPTDHADVLDRFRGIRDRSYTLAVDGTATVYDVSDQAEPPFNSVGVSDAKFIGITDDAVYSSSDGGQAWDLSAVNARQFLADTSGAVVALSDRNVYRTQSRGMSWTVLSPPGGYPYSPVTVVDHANVYVAGAKGLFVTGDGGKSWKRLSDLADIHQIAVSGARLAIYHAATSGGFLSSSTEAQFRISSDGGGTWTTMAPPSRNVASLRMTRDALYGVSEGRVVVLQGDSWVALTAPDQVVNQLVGGDGGLYALTYGREILCSEDGRSWAKAVIPMDPATGEYLDTTPTGSISSDGTDAVLLTHSPKGGHLYRGRSGAAQWIRLPDPPDRGMTSVSNSGGTLVVRTAAGAYMCSLSAPSDWRRLLRLSPGFTSFDKHGIWTSGSKLFLFDEGLYRSEDDGRTWEQVAVGTSQPQFVQPDRAGLLAVSTSELLTSSNDGRTWTALPRPGKGSIEILRRFQGTLYAVEVEQSSSRNQSVLHIWKHDSQEPGWHLVAEASDFAVKDLVVDRGRIYALAGNAVLSLTAAGTWENLSAGPLIAAEPKALYVNSRGVLFVATPGGLFWRHGHGTDWRPAAVELASGFRSAERIVPYSSDGFMLLANGRLYLCVDRTPTPAAEPFVAVARPGQQPSGGQDDREVTIPLSLNAGEVSILLDGHELPANAVDRNESAVTLRGDAKVWKTLPDGVSSVEIRGKGKGTLQEKAYVLKEQLSARIFRPYGRSYAVLVAISNYANSGYKDLPAAIKQAKELAAVLTAQGFEVKPLYDAGRSEIERYLFQDLAPRLGSEDRLVVYFAGHGDTLVDVMGKSVGYFVSFGAQKTSLATDAIPMARLEQEYARLLKAKHILFVLDACLSGLALTREPSKDLETLVEVRQLTENRARAIFAAGRSSDPALDDNGGIFTTAFIAGITGAADRNRNGVVTPEELYEYVRGIVAAEAVRHNSEQLPQFEPLREFGDGGFLFIYR
jgi:photosystem II stability/assembly factor-like uncharacterized protein